MKDRFMDSEDEMGRIQEEKRRIAREMNKFSWAPWSELEDIWPRNVRMGSDAYTIISVILPAIHVFNKRYKIRTRELFLLFWMQRCEEAKENLGTLTFTVGDPLDIKTVGKQNLFAFRKSVLHRLKLIEGFPNLDGYRPRIYRVTAEGKAVMAEFIDMLEQAHRNVKYMPTQEPPHSKELNNKYFRTFYSYAKDNKKP